MPTSTPVTLVSKLLLFATLCTAARTPGSFTVIGFGNPVVVGREDPIINPGSVSSHVHTVIGGNAFGPSMSDQQALQQSTCTTSQVKNDRSNYWVPSLYFHASNGSFIPVQATQFNVYYIFEQSDDKMEPFDPGLRILVGDPFLRSKPQNTGYNIDPAMGPIQPIQMSCPGSKAYASQDPRSPDTGVGFPDRDCNAQGTGLRYDIYFPSCYDSASASLSNYKNNMQYSSSRGASPGSKNCPPNWKHHPQLHLEVYWDVHAFVNEWTQGTGTSPWVLAQGDPTGYGLHGDFISGWDTNTLDTLIKTCNSGDSRVDKCPSVPGGINSNAEMNSCSIAPSVAEPIWGVLDHLPGCNPIQNGPGPAIQQTSCGATTSLSQPTTQFTDVTAEKGWKYIGCFTDMIGGQRVLDKASQNAYTATIIPVTVESCIDFCSSKGYSVAGLEDGMQCWCDQSMNSANGNGRESGLCNRPCQSNPKQICGGALGSMGFLSVYEKCIGPCHNAATLSPPTNLTGRGVSRAGPSRKRKHNHRGVHLVQNTS